VHDMEPTGRRPSARTIQRNLRRLSWLCAGAALLYLFTRYEFLRLPSENCSPIALYRAGETLLVDTRCREYPVDSALVFRGTDGRRYIARVTASEAERGVWVESDNVDCPGKGSDEFGWIPPESWHGRILFAWPW